MKVKIIGKEVKNLNLEGKIITIRRIYCESNSFGNSKDLVMTEGVKCDSFVYKSDESVFESLKIGKEYNIAVYYDGKKYICNGVFIND